MIIKIISGILLSSSILFSARVEASVEAQCHIYGNEIYNRCMVACYAVDGSGTQLCFHGIVPASYCENPVGWKADCFVYSNDTAKCVWSGAPHLSPIILSKRACGNS